jgi:hypothetical protein
VSWHYKQNNMKNFHRDTATTALLNTDDSVIRNYKARKEQMQKIKDMEQDVNNIKHELVEIKNMLHQILTKV